MIVEFHHLPLELGCKKRSRRRVEVNGSTDVDVDEVVGVSAPIRTRSATADHPQRRGGPVIVAVDLQAEA
ncbi:hypothetical protein CP556_12775 [Natrinema sp. CBA1119]|nr:hypothetical protein CP556_12775 [Natrinema sp. CBA1119]